MQNNSGMLLPGLVTDGCIAIVRAETMAPHMPKDLVLRVIKTASKNLMFSRDCVLHRGGASKYTSKAVTTVLAERGVPQSFSRGGLPSDHSKSESIVVNLEEAPVYWRYFKTVSEARQAIFASIEALNDTRRV